MRKADAALYGVIRRYTALYGVRRVDATTSASRDFLEQAL